MAAYYTLALCLDINMPTCITARNPAARSRFGGYQIDYAALSLPAVLVEELTTMREEYGKLFDFETGAHSTVEEERAYLARLEALVPKLLAVLGPDYEFEIE